MYRNRFIRLLLLPSLFSSICGCIIVFAVILSANWALILENMPFYDYFFGREGVVTNLQGATAAASTLDEAADSKVLSILAGVLVAIGALVLLVRGISRLVTGISWTVQEMRAADGPAKDAIERELGKRLSVRMLVALLWAGYIFVSLKIIVPFGILASQLAFSNESSIGEGVGYLLFALALLLACVHLHVIMARLLILRPRVFGGEEALLVS